ncbi:hypothetical protein IMG5_029430, partial [Ichthyophthirius multifiliis]
IHNKNKNYSSLSFKYIKMESQYFDFEVEIKKLHTNYISQNAYFQVSLQKDDNIIENKRKIPFNVYNYDLNINEIFQFKQKFKMNQKKNDIENEYAEIQFQIYQDEKEKQIFGIYQINLSDYIKKYPNNNYNINDFLNNCQYKTTKIFFDIKFERSDISTSSSENSCSMKFITEIKQQSPCQSKQQIHKSIEYSGVKQPNTNSLTPKIKLTSQNRFYTQNQIEKKK